MHGLCFALNMLRDGLGGWQAMHSPSSRKAMMKDRGTVPQPADSNSVKGSSVSQIMRKREVWRVSARGQGGKKSA